MTKHTTRASLLLALTAATLLSALPAQLGSDAARVVKLDAQLRSVGIDQSMHFSESDWEPGADHRWGFPRLDAARLELGERLTFVLPGGRPVAIPLVSRELAGTATLEFIFSDPARGASAEIVVHKGRVHGTLRAHLDGRHEEWTYASTPDGERFMPAAHAGECAGCAGGGKPAPGESEGGSQGDGGIAGGCTDTGQLIDVLLAYTPAFAAGFADQSALEAALAADIATANAAFVNSRLFTRYRAVAFHALTTNGSGSIGADLDAITNPTDGIWDDVQPAREDARADLVTVYSDSGGGGVAWLGVGNADFGYAAVGGTGGTLLAHELGHTMGACHAINDGGGCDGGGFYPFSNGWRFDAAGTTYRTVMAYIPGEQIPYFSNPDVEYIGVPTGVPGQSYPESANNARTHGLTANIVANYRCSIGSDFDCDGDGIPDDQAIANGDVPDCNATGLPDSCDIAIGVSLDLDNDGVPDECPLSDIEFAATGVTSLDTLGSAVGISSKDADPFPYLALGAPGSDIGASNAGTAYVFSVVGGVPIPLAQLQAASPATNEFFGRGLSVFKRPERLVTPVYPERNFVLVGAYRATDFASTGTFPSKGAVYCFAQEGGVWNQLWRYTPPATGGFAARENALFGYSVAMGRAPTEGVDQIVVGAPGHTNGRGKVYMMRNYFPFNVIPPAERGGITKTVQLTTGADGDNFGYAVALETYLPVLTTSRVIAVVGAPGRSNAKGAAYVYDRGPFSSTTGSIGSFPTSGISLNPVGEATLKEGDRFGSAVAVNLNLVVVGAPGAFGGRGAIYFWERSTSQINSSLAAYQYRGFFTAPDGLEGDALGTSIAVAPSLTGSGFTVVVGAPKADVTLPDGVRTNAGKVYVLHKELGETGAALTEIRTTFNPAAGDEFGYSASSIEGFSIIGAPFSDITGLNSGKARLLTTP
ncbi:MAG: hypothetical protein RL136_62 [Planctomycetota bacterium]|jgi:hypothetical protein